MWTPEGKRPIVVTTGSHKKTCVFGTITFDGRQLFRQYDTFDQYSFISYLRELKGKFHKLILFLDRAPQHCRSKRVKAYLQKNNDPIFTFSLPSIKYLLAYFVNTFRIFQHNNSYIQDYDFYPYQTFHE